MIVPHTLKNIGHFSDPRDLIVLIATRVEHKITESQRSIIISALRRVTDATPDAVKENIVRMLEDIAWAAERPVILTAYTGEDFSIRLDLEMGYSFLGRVLTLRDVSTPETKGTLVSRDGVLGSDAGVQNIFVDDLALPTGFHRLHALLEVPTETGLASGNAASLLTSVYLNVTDSIDSELPVTF